MWKNKLIGLQWTGEQVSYECGDVTSVGKVLFQTSSDKGAGTLQQHEFEGALQKIISQQIPNKLEVPVIICGMAGSRQGWKEAQYVKMPTESSQIFQSVLTVRVENQRLKVYIIPGLMPARN